MDLTVIVLTRNEERNIRQCLESAMPLGAEILVLDEHSTDSTCSIARSLGARVIDVPDGVSGFGPKRRYAVSRAKYDKVLHLDADERLTPELIGEIKEAMGSLRPESLVEIPRLTYLFGTAIRHCGWYPDRKRRLYDRRHADFDSKLVHEDVPVPAGSQVIAFRHPLLHYSYPKLEDFWRKQGTYPALWGRDKASRGRRCTLASIPFRAMFSFVRTYVIRGGFLDGRAGLWLSIANMGYEAAKYLSLYEAGREIDCKGGDPSKDAP
ncbi:MAG: glycosyltransferase family 2 protein [Succinivibrio sp.]